MQRSFTTEKNSDITTHTERRAGSEIPVSRVCMESTPDPYYCGDSNFSSLISNFQMNMDIVF